MNLKGSKHAIVVDERLQLWRNDSPAFARARSFLIKSMLTFVAKDRLWSWKCGCVRRWELRGARETPAAAAAGRRKRPWFRPTIVLLRERYPRCI